MNVIFRILTLFLLIAILGSCGKPQPQATLLLTQAEQLIENYPDSALALIDSIYYPEKSFNKKNYMRYCLVRVQVRHKNYLPIGEDTLIFKAKEYFTKKNPNSETAALACYYSGWVRREQGDLNQAILDYKDAASYADNTNNTALKGLIQYNIGALFRSHGLFDEALHNYQLAERLYLQSPEDNRAKLVYCQSEIGQMYMLLGKQDSAFSYFHKGFEIAESIDNRVLQSLIAQNLSIAYSELKQYDKASQFLRQSFILNDDSVSLPGYYLNLAELYESTGQQDSLSFYINKLVQTVDFSSNLYFKASAYNFLADYFKGNQKYESAFEFQKKRNETSEDINEERFQQSIYEAKQKYDYIQQQKKHDLQLLQRQRYSIVLLAFLLLFSLLSVLLLKRVVRQKNSLLSLQNTIQVLYKTAKDLQKQKSTESGQEKQLREILLWKFNILHKSSLLRSELDHLEKLGAKKAIAKYDDIVYGKNNESQWDSLVEAIDELNPGLSQFILKTFPQFNETEFKVCILSYAGLPPKEIAILINQSVNSVNMTRTRIRQKMNLQEHRADFCDFIKDIYNKSRFEE